MLGLLNLPREQVVETTMAHVFTVDIDVAVTGLPSNPHETPCKSAIIEVLTEPLRLSVDVVASVLGMEV